MSNDLSRAEQRKLANVLLTGHLRKPTTKQTLRDWIYVYLFPIRLPLVSVCPQHQTPMDYIWDSFQGNVDDVVIWSNRGGGKTLSGAIMTFMDTRWNDGLEVRILGGSRDQSDKMYSYVKNIYLDNKFRNHIIDEPHKNSTKLVNGSTIEILTQSPKSVRGPHVPVMRLDEVDEFNADIFDSALMAASSKGKFRRRVEIFSTMHKQYGLMRELVANHIDRGFRLYKWCVLDVLEPCNPERYDCKICILKPECQGRARHADGFFPILDAMRIKQSSSEERWNSEMLCTEPSSRGRIWKDFQLDTHVVSYESLQSKKFEYAIAGVDFGYAQPSAILFLAMESDGFCYIIDEIYEREKTTEQLIEMIREKTKKYSFPISRYYCDAAEPDRIRLFSSAGLRAEPAIKNVSLSNDNVSVLFKMGSDGRPRLRVSRKCRNSIEEFLAYSMKEGTDHPNKWNDHCPDALRYMVASDPMLQSLIVGSRSFKVMDIEDKAIVSDRSRDIFKDLRECFFGKEDREIDSSDEIGVNSGEYVSGKMPWL